MLLENGRIRPSVEDEETFKRFRRTIGSFHEWADERLDPDLLAIATELLTTAGSAGCFRTLDRQLGLYLLHAHPICRVSFSLREEARVSHAGCQLGECPVPVALHRCTIAGTPDFFLTLAIVEPRREIVVVPTKLQNNNRRVYKCRKNEKRNQRERERRI